MPRSSVYLDATTAERLKALDIGPTEALKRGVEIASVEEAVRRVVREELEAWFGPKSQETTCE